MMIQMRVPVPLSLRRALGAGCRKSSPGVILMSVIDNMIRLHRWQLEERERYLADLESLAERLRADAQRLEREAAEEARLAGISLDAPADAPLSIFLRPLVERRRKLERSVGELEGQIAEAREAVATARQEVKLYEMAWEQRGVPPTGQRLTRRMRRLLEAQQTMRAAQAARKQVI